MVDMVLPRPARWRARTNTSPVRLALSAALLLALLIVLTWSWSAVTTDTAQRCEPYRGALSVRGGAAIWPQWRANRTVDG